MIDQKCPKLKKTFKSNVKYRFHNTVYIQVELVVLTSAYYTESLANRLFALGNKMTLIED